MGFAHSVVAMSGSPRSARWLPPTGMTVSQLNRDLPVGAAPAILDVREWDAFQGAHIPGSVHAPDSRPADLVCQVERHPRVVLVCEDGRMSAMVARTLKFSGIADPLFLVGGLKAWEGEGGALQEISATGQEHRVVRDTIGETAVRRLAPIGKAMSVRVLFLALAASAAVVALVLLTVQ